MRFKFAHKLFAIAAILVLPLCYTAGSYVRLSYLTRVANLEEKRQVLPLIAALSNLLRQVEDHQAKIPLWIMGQKANSEEQTESARKILVQNQAVDELMRQRPEFLPMWASLRSRVNAVFDNPKNPIGFEDYSVVTLAIINQIRSLSFRANLFAGGKTFVTFNRIAADLIPALGRNVNELRGRMTYKASIGEFSLEDIRKMSGIASLTQAGLAELIEVLGIVANDHTELTKEVTSDAKELERLADVLKQRVEAVLGGQADDAQSNAIFLTSDDIIQRLGRVDAMITSFNAGRLNQEINQYLREAQQVAAGVGLAILLALLLTFLLSQAFVRNIQTIIDLAEKIASGRRDVAFPGVLPKDESGKIMSAFQRTYEAIVKHEATIFAELETKKLVADISEQVHNIDDLNHLANVALDFFSKNFQSVFVAFFRIQAGDPPTFKFRQGLNMHGAQEIDLEVGSPSLLQRAYYERRTTIISGLTVDQISPLATSNLRIMPTCVMVTPVIFEGRMLGVLEMGFVTAPDPRTVANIEALVIPLGIRSYAVSQTNQLRALVVERSEQAKRLETQQIELVAVNEELSSNARMLEQQQRELEGMNDELKNQQVFLEEEKDRLEILSEELRRAKEDNEAKAREASSANQHKSEFLAKMSHELRTPLNSIMILSQILAENRGQNMNEDQVKNANNIYSSGKDLLQLINDILDLSKIEAGQQTVSLLPFYLEDIVENIEAYFRHQATNKGLELKIVRAPGLVDRITSDRARVEQILRNLVSNALKFTETGTITVRFCPANEATPAPATRWRDHAIAIMVTDTGIGIPSDRLNVIFEPFRQIDSSISRKYTGTGLGLTISKNFAELLGGCIAVVSELEKGTTFTLFLPNDGPATVPAISEHAESNDAVKPIAPKKPGARFHIADDRKYLRRDDRTILLVEDDNKFAQVMASRCHEKGFKVLHAEDGEAAMADLGAYTIAGIILDIHLPDVSGLSILDRLKHNPATRHIPVHAVSIEDHRIDALHLGALDFIQKPIKIADLDRAINELATLTERKTTNILLLGSDPRQVDTIRDLINDPEVKIAFSGSYQEAVDKLREHHYDCLIMHPSLIESDGIQLFSTISDQHLIRRLPIIVHSEIALSTKAAATIHEYARSFVLLESSNTQRLLDQITLFLHRVEKNANPLTPSIPTSGNKHHFKGKCALVVDDDIRNIFAIRQVLLAQDLAVLTAHSGPEAIKMLESKKNAIDIVLMDIMMPGMDGIEAMKRIRRNPDFKDLPIIAVTAKAMKQDRKDCIDAGANDYLSKPIDIEQLVSLIRVWLTHRALQ